MILILDVGKLDESNIILGKRRRRRKIDYSDDDAEESSDASQVASGI